MPIDRPNFSQNLMVGVAVICSVVGCIMLGDWLARGKGNARHQYCSTTEGPDKSANERRHELCQQWRSAEAADESIHVAWLQLLLSIAGLGVLIATILYAAKSARAAGDAAKEAARSVEIQVRIEQPLLFITHVVAPAHEYDGAQFNVRNLGKTPAVLSTYFAVFEARDSLPERPQYGQPRRLLGKVLESGDSEQFTTPPVGKDALLAIYGRQQTAFCWGYLRYEDVFGRTRVTGFAFAGHPMTDEAGTVVPGLLWSRTGGTAYNFDIAEDVYPKA